jgi:hypothetical protein
MISSSRSPKAAGTHFVDHHFEAAERTFAAVAVADRNASTAARVTSSTSSSGTQSKITLAR